MVVKSTVVTTKVGFQLSGYYDIGRWYCTSHMGLEYSLQKIPYRWYFDINTNIYNFCTTLCTTIKYLLSVKTFLHKSHKYL